MLKGTFQYTEDLDGGKMKIATEPGHSSYLVFDIIKQTIISYHDGDRVLDAPEPNTHLQSLHEFVVQVVDNALESEVPSGIAKCMHL